MFVSTMCKGFHMTFENELTASVQWGYGNYCDNRFNPQFGDYSSTTAEVAVFKGGAFIPVSKFLPDGCYADDDVCGYLTADQVAEFLWNVKNA